MHRDKNFSLKNFLIYGLIIGIFLLFPKSSFSAMYSPGETLDPSCLPTDVNCGVYPSVSLTTSTYAVGDILFASTTDAFGLLNLGTAGQFLMATSTGIVWSTIPGGGDLLSTNNLSELTNLVDARSNLGLVIGTDVQAYNAGLADIAGLSLTNGNFIVSDGANWTTQSSSTVKTTLGLSNVENISLSTWTGNTSISSLGTIATGTWQGDLIASGYLGLNVMLEGEDISLLNNDANYVTTTQATTLAKAAISTSGLALNYTDGVISVASGYEIPSNASTTNWNSTYDLVTASSTNWDTAFSWGNHASIGYLVSGNNLSDLNSSSTARTNLGLGNVENTALSTWIGSPNITTLGTITSGVWNGTKIVSSSLADNVMIEGENISLLNNDSNFVDAAGARSAITTSSLALTYDSVTGAIGIATGYEVPTTASTTNWNIAYNTVNASSTNWDTAFSWGDHSIQNYFDLDSGALAVINGGTGATTASGARINLGLGSIATQDSNNVSISGGSINNTNIGNGTPSTGIFTNVTSTELAISGGNIYQTAKTSLTKLTDLNLSDSIRSIYVSGKYAYVGTQSTDPDFHVIDISDPNNPVEIGSGMSWASASVLSVYVSGKYAYVGTTSVTGNDLHIIDISSPTNLVEVGGIDLSASANSIYVSGKYAYVGSSSVTGNDFHIIDISNPSSPVDVGGQDFSTNVNSVYVSGDYAYVGITSSTGNDFQVVDISDPYNSVLDGGFDLNNTVLSIYVSGKYAYVGTSGTPSYDNNFHIFDISNSTAPLDVGSLAFTNDSIDSIYVVDKYAYVSATSGLGGKLYAIDVSTPTAPTSYASFSLADAGRSIYISGKYAYVGIQSSANEFNIFDIGGIKSPSANIGNLESNNINITDNLRVSNDAYIGNGLVLGNGGLLSFGGLSISGSNSTSTFAGNVNISGLLNSLIIPDTATGTLALLSDISAGISTDATGLTYSTSTGVLSLDPSYEIPLVASTTNWNSAYDIVNSSSTNWNSAYDTVNASSTYWDTAFSWGNHAGAGYAILAGQSGGQTLNGGTGASESLTLSSTANATKGNILFGSSAYNEATNRLLLATTTDGGYTLDVASGNARVKNSLYLGDSLAGGNTGIYIWSSSGWRSALATTALGKISYQAPGGTQGLEFLTTNRNILMNMTQMDINTSDPASYGTSHLYLSNAFNGGGNYAGIRMLTNDISSSSTVKMLDLSVTGATTGNFVVQKNGYVGINTTTPENSLVIDGISNATEDGLYITASTDGTSERAALSLDNWNIGQDYNADGTKNFYIKDTASSTARFFIDKQGNIGIGTTSPSSSFHLASGSFTQTVGTNPVLAGSLTGGAIYRPYASYVVGKYAYVASSGVSLSGSVQILDISDSANPVQIGTVASSSLYGAESIFVSGNYAYVGSFGDNSLQVLDVSNPTSPSIVGGIQSTSLQGIRSVYVSGNYVYAANFTNDSLRVINITDPTSPVISGGLTATTLNGASGVYVVDNYAYVVNNLDQSMRVVDVSDPTSPSIVGGIQDSSLNGAQSISVSGRYAYVVSNVADSFTIIDVSNPVTTTPIIASISNASLNGAYSVQVSGDYAYVASYSDNSLQVIDISDPNNPNIVGSLQDNTVFNLITSVFVSGKYAYTTGFTNNYFATVELTGIKAPSAEIGSLQSNNANITENLNVNNDVYVGNGLSVGGNTKFDGLVSVSGDFNLTDNVSTTYVGNTIDFNFVNGGVTKWTLREMTSNDYFYIINNSTQGVYLKQGDIAWTGTSDERLKENVVDLNVLDRIDSYRAVSFDWKDSGKHDIGAIAQELYNVFPEAVSVGSEELGEQGEGAWGIQYAKLGALALEGVKELKQQLDVYNALLLTGGLNDFVGEMAQSNMLTFSQNVTFNNHVTFGVDNVGSATILAGENGVRVEFEQEFTTPPIVNLTLASDVSLDTYFVDSVDTKGFTIRIRPTQGQDIVINWHAFGQVSADNNLEQTATQTDSSSSGVDNLTDIANNYLSDNGLILEDTLTSSTDDAITTSTDFVESVTSTENIDSVSSTEENTSSDVTEITNNEVTNTEEIVPEVVPDTTVVEETTSTNNN